MKKLCLATAVAVSFSFVGTGCVINTSAVDGNSQNLTVGKVQKEIKIGMSGADVAMVMGSPNIVTTDNKRQETWIYDRVSSDYVSATSEGWIFGGIVGASGGRHSSSQSQRMLTVVIKFDGKGLVRDFAYHTSKF